MDGDTTLDARLDAGFDFLVVPHFEAPPSDEVLYAFRATYDLGIGLRLYFLWCARMDELGIDQLARWADLELATELMGGDRLEGLEFPFRIHGCGVDLTDTLGYEIRSSGPLGGEHVTRFLPEGDEASIVSAEKVGRIAGARSVDVPLPRHVEVLREFGFTRMRFPNGKRYELRTWPGVRRIE